MQSLASQPQQILDAIVDYILIDLADLRFSQDESARFISLIQEALAEKHSAELLKLLLKTDDLEKMISNYIEDAMYDIEQENAKSY